MGNVKYAKRCIETGACQLRVAQLVEYQIAGTSVRTQTLGVVMLTSNSSIQEVEAGGSGIKDQLPLHGNFRASLVYTKYPQVKVLSCKSSDPNSNPRAHERTGREN